MSDRLTWGYCPSGEPPPEGEPLPEEYWPLVGVRPGPHGPTHALGDEHARKIVEGEIDFEKARKAERKVEHQRGAERRRKLFNSNRGRW